MRPSCSRRAACGCRRGAPDGSCCHRASDARSAPGSPRAPTGSRRRWRSWHARPIRCTATGRASPGRWRNGATHRRSRRAGSRRPGSPWKRWWSASASRWTPELDAIRAWRPSLWPVFAVWLPLAGAGGLDRPRARRLPSRSRMARRVTGILILTLGAGRARGSAAAPAGGAGVGSRRTRLARAAGVRGRRRAAGRGGTRGDGRGVTGHRAGAGERGGYAAVAARRRAGRRTRGRQLHGVPVVRQARHRYPGDARRVGGGRLADSRRFDRRDASKGGRSSR